MNSFMTIQNFKRYNFYLLRVEDLVKNNDEYIKNKYI